MAITTHTHTADHTAPVDVRTGYATYNGARRWIDTHAAPSGHCYGVAERCTDGTTITYAIVCDTIDGRSDGTVPTPLATRYGVAITNVHAPTSFIETADGYGYAAPMPGHDTYGAPTVPANDATPTFDDDMAPIRTMVADDDTDTYGMTPHTGTHTEPGYTGPVCTIATGVMVTGTYGDLDTDGFRVEHTYTGTVGAPTGMAMLGNAGYRIHTTDGDMITVSRLAVVTIYGATDTDTDNPTTDDATAHTDAPTANESTYDAMTPYTTYDGTTRLARWIDGTRSTCTDYTAIAGGGIVTRTYAYDDGTYVTTRTDANHQWVADDVTGDTITYVAADHTYYRMAARDLDATPVTAVAWAKAGAPTCNHSYAGYGACIAPFGHTHAEHIDANGNQFTGRSHRFSYGELGPVAPATYTRVVTRVPFKRDTYRTVLRADVADMVNDYAYLMAAMGHPFRTDGQAYAALVIGMPYDTYEPAAIHYPAYADALDAHYSV